MTEMPTGTVTFLFTDIEGSTRLWEEHPEAMRLALARHDTLLRESIERHNGHVFKTVGDAFCAAFDAASDALKAALDVHLALQQQSWNEIGPICVRMGLHTGVAEERDGDYFGPTLNRVARLQAIGHGQQTLLSEATYQLVCDSLPEKVMLLDRGQHRLKDLLAPEHVWQLLHPALPTELPPLKSLDYLPTNLPRQMTSFIGREPEMVEVKRLLSSTPLLTLLGTGGAGKTRLALQVGAEMLDAYRDGVWLVELAGLAETDLVPQTVAAVWGLREEMGRPLLQSVQDYLRDRHLLLILDNCEHLLDACAHLADALLKSCRQVTILATSREPLGTAGERSWRVPSLLAPDPADLPLEEKDLAAVLMDYDACRLFLDRTLLHRQEFVVTRHNAPALVSVCHRLDGIPLAIELAAARMRSLTVEEIDGKLDNRFRLLTGGSRTALPRQQTLRALIDWSYDLLDAQEKTLLARLSVFAGGWTLGAAEQVCSGEREAGESIEEWEVLDLLTSLADKSMVITESAGDSTRYRLLETVRQYAHDRLIDSDESYMVSRKHRDYFLTLVEEARQKLSGPVQAQWLLVLEAEHDNLRQALAFCLEDPEGGEQGLRFGAALWGFWHARGHLSEGRGHFTALLSHPGAQAHSKARTEALNGAGVLAFFQSDFASARALHEEGLKLCRALGDRKGAGFALGNLGNVAATQSDYASARVLMEESLAIKRELGDRKETYRVLNNLGNVANELGDYALARTLHEESLAIQQEFGDRHGIADSLNNLGILACGRSDYATARVLFEESLEIHRKLGPPTAEASNLSGLGNVAFYQGDYVAARFLYEESLAIRRKLGDRWGGAASLMNIGTVALNQGDYAAARSLYTESLEIWRVLGEKRGIAESLQSCASLALKEASHERAVRLCGAASALREVIGSPLPPNEREQQDLELAAAREATGETLFTVAWNEGSAMTMEQAIAYALCNDEAKESRGD